MFIKIYRSVAAILSNTQTVTEQGLKSIAKDPQIMVYPFLAGIFILVTLPTVSGLVFAIWDKIAPHSLYTAGDHVPHRIRIILGLVTFSYFYITVVTTYFTCAVSAAVLAKLDGHPTSLAHGLRIVLRRFRRISHFAVLAIFFTPISLVAQRRKLFSKKFYEAIGSSLSLHTAQLAPSILTSEQSTTQTIRNSVDTLGKLWKEGLVIKIWMWSLALVLTSVSFLPKLIQHYWLHGPSAHWVGWLTTTVLVLTFWVTTKVLGAVFVTVLYHCAQKEMK